MQLERMEKNAASTYRATLDNSYLNIIAKIQKVITNANLAYDVTQLPVQLPDPTQINYRNFLKHCFYLKREINNETKWISNFPNIKHYKTTKLFPLLPISLQPILLFSPDAYTPIQKHITRSCIWNLFETKKVFLNSQFPHTKFQPHLADQKLMRKQTQVMLFFSFPQTSSPILYLRIIASVITLFPDTN